MNLLIFDCGETNIRHAYWNNNQLEQRGTFKTPSTWEQLKQDFLTIYESSQKTINGIALSVPGTVNKEKQRIEGNTTISYLLGFNIFAELEELFGLPVTIENDINCAGMAEFYLGAAKDTQDAVFVSMGNEISGTLFLKGQIHKGIHLYGGHFGLMYLNNGNNFSELATPVQMAFRYCKRMGLDPAEKKSAAVFALAKTEDRIAKEEVNNFYEYFAQGLWNIQFSYDPELIVLGTATSEDNDLEELLDEINQRLLQKLTANGIVDFVPKIVTSQCGKVANLIGAAANFFARQHGEA